MIGPGRSATHLPEPDLLALVQPGARPSASVRSHLAACDSCRATLGVMRILQQTLSASPPPRASLVARSRVYSLLAPPLPRGRRRLAFRPASMLAAGHGIHGGVSGLRGELQPVRSMWRLGTDRIRIRIEGRGLGGSAALTGLLLPARRVDEGTTGSAWLVERGHGVHWAPVHTGGEFVLPAPEVARWRLLVEWGPLRAELAPAGSVR